ncbi:MAG: glutamate synthase domain-containing protein 2 [Candidatus Aldehydirespiratoraceae bacterium]|jgi:glutamate synthase domain-containing protein 2
MQPHRIASWSELDFDTPTGVIVSTVDLVLVRWAVAGTATSTDDPETTHSVMYGRCLHRGVKLADGHVAGEDLICGVHGWDYRLDSGVSSYNNDEALHRFTSWIDGDDVFVDLDEIEAWEFDNPQPYNRSAYLGEFADVHGGPEETQVQVIQSLAKNGLSKTGSHGPAGAMGVPIPELPAWDSIQFVTAQLDSRPLLDEVDVATGVTIGPKAAKPLHLDIPLFVSDMSFGALSEEAKVSLARGAELAGTGICSGEGGMLPEEHAENSRYFYELASAKFGWSIDKVRDVQAFHFKFGQGAKTGTGGHLPGAKVVGKISEVRGIAEGVDAISPSTFTDLVSESDFRDVAEQVRSESGGIPIGAKLSAQHIERDIDAALRIGVDYIILDGRGGGTGAAPLLFRDNISVPTIPALARARRHLDKLECGDVTLVITGGLRTPADFAKALALGADAIAVSNSALQAIGCLGMRACNTDNCPVGIATQKKNLRSRLIVEESARQLAQFFTSTTHLLAVLARACGHDDLTSFNVDDLTTFDREMAHLTGISYGGVML